MRKIVRLLCLLLMAAPTLFAIDNLKLNPQLGYESDSLDGPLITGSDVQSGFVPDKTNYVIMYGEGCFNSKRQARRTIELHFAMTAAPSEDAMLVHASKTGYVAAFEELVKRYDSKLLRIAQHVTHNREDAEDAVQEAFLKAFQKLSQFQEHSKFSTWLIRSTINQSLVKLRKQRRQREVSVDQDFQTETGTLSLEIADWAPNPEQRYTASELKEILTKTLQELKLAFRVVFVLLDIEGLSLGQTAEALDLTVSAVKARSWRARLQLRERLSKYFRKTGELAVLSKRGTHQEITL